MKGIYTTPKLFLRAVKIHISGRICQKKTDLLWCKFGGGIRKTTFLKSKIWLWRGMFILRPSPLNITGIQSDKKLLVRWHKYPVIKINYDTMLRFSFIDVIILVFKKQNLPRSSQIPSSNIRSYSYHWRFYVLVNSHYRLIDKQNNKGYL